MDNELTSGIWMKVQINLIPYGKPLKPTQLTEQCLKSKEPITSKISILKLKPPLMPISQCPVYVPTHSHAQEMDAQLKEATPSQHSPSENYLFVLKSI
jgi:hypothetical protein